MRKEADLQDSRFGILPEVLSSRSSTLPDSEDVMGWNINDNGFQVVFSRDIPSLIRTNLKKDVEAFLNAQNVGLDDIQVFLAHPGGKKYLMLIWRASVSQKNILHVQDGS